MLIGSHAGGLTGCLLYEQGFVKQILDVADNLERAAGAVPGTALENGEAVDTAELQKQLRTLLEGVRMTQQVLTQVSDSAPTQVPSLQMMCCCTVSCTMCSAF